MARSRSPQPATLLIAHAVLHGRKDRKVIRMVVDTGATTTIIPPQVALAIGCDPARAKRRLAIITATGLEYLPVVVVPQIESLGRRVRHLAVASHDLPPQSTVDGLLGLDFLRHVEEFQKFHRAIQGLRG